MPGSLRLAFTQIRGLLNGNVAPNGRAQPTALTDHTELCRGDRYAVPEEIARAMVLEIVGGERFPDFISEPGGLRKKMLRLTVSVQLGGGENGTQGYGETQMVLADITDDAIKVIEDPLNYARATTGLWNVHDLRDAEYVTKNGRRHASVTFVVDYWQDYAAL